MSGLNRLFSILALASLCCLISANANAQNFSAGADAQSQKDKNGKKDQAKEKKPRKNKNRVPAKRELEKKERENSKPAIPMPESKANSRLDVIESKIDLLVKQMAELSSDDSPEDDAAKPGAPGDQKKPEIKPAPELKILPEWLKDISWRSIGPANMGGRITDLDIHAQDSSLWWVATASGGLLKTNNQGTTVEHQFDHETTVSIGAISSDPQNKDVVWVGTGEINPRNSVSFGDGVYKSVDGGKTWKNMGLKDSYQISRILVHPEDSDTVYVGAQGRLYGTNKERGVFKTTDGGETWKKVLYIDERTGVIDMIMHPEDPDVIIAAMWDRKRDEFDSWPGSIEKPEGIDGYDPIRKWGPKAGLYKTSNGGKKWTKLTNGLPEGMTGRIGLDWQKGGDHAIFAIIDCEDIGKGPEPFRAFLGLSGINEKKKAIIIQVVPNSPAAKSGLKAGDVLLTADEEKIEDFDKLLDILRKKTPGEAVALKVERDGKTLETRAITSRRPEARNAGATILVGVSGSDVDGKATLNTITRGGPAEKAGLKKGDIVLKSEGEKIEDYSKWVQTLQAKAIGDKVDVVVLRGEDEVEATIELAARVGTAQRSSAFMGIQGQNAEGTSGAALTVITSGGPSEKAGLKAGDIVQKVADKKIENYDGLIAEIRSRKPDDEMPVEVKRGDKTVKLTIILGDRNGSNRTRPYTYSYYGQLPNVQDQQGAKGHNYGGIYKSTDSGDSWQRVNSLNVRPMYFSVIRVDPNDDQRVYVLGVSQFQSSDGGATFSSNFGRGVHSDCHDLWIDPADGRHMVIGGDGGFYVTHDRGSNWDHINTAAIGQFYHAAIAPTAPYRVYGGLQDNGSWGGPAISKSGGALIQDWVSVGGGDGFVCRVDPEDPDLVYFESQNGSIRRRNLRTGQFGSIRPQRDSSKEYRFNWNTPFILSHHNPKIFYSAGNYVFRSVKQGDSLAAISPEITRTPRGSATALSESPLDPNVLYAGTDDGALWSTRDGGQNWTDITDNLGVDPSWVATIEASRHQPGRVLVCLDAHRSDSDRPFAFLSEDYGETFKLLTSELPRGSSRCLREDVSNPNLFYLGTEFAFWISLDRGKNWTQFNQTLPTVAIHEVAMHPDLNEIVLATHGRSLWACDVSGLRGFDAEAVKKVSLLPPADVTRWRREPSRGRTNRRYIAQNPASGARIWYHLPETAKKVRIQIKDINNTVINELTGKTEAGLNTASWNLTQTPQRGNRGPGGRAGAGARPGGAGRGFGGRGGARPVSSGNFRVVLLVDDKEVGSQILTLHDDPTIAADAISEAEYLEGLALQAELEDEEEDDSDLDQ